MLDLEIMIKVLWWILTGVLRFVSDSHFSGISLKDISKELSLSNSVQVQALQVVSLSGVGSHFQVGLWLSWLWKYLQKVLTFLVNSGVSFASGLTFLHNSGVSSIAQVWKEVAHKLRCERGGSLAQVWKRWDVWKRWLNSSGVKEVAH